MFLPVPLHCMAGIAQRSPNGGRGGQTGAATIRPGLERAALRSGGRDLWGRTGALRHCRRLQRNASSMVLRRFHRSGRWKTCSRSAGCHGDAGCAVRICARLTERSAGRHRGGQNRRGFRRVVDCHRAVLHRGSDTAHLSGSRPAADPTCCGHARLHHKEGDN